MTRRSRHTGVDLTPEERNAYERLLGALRSGTPVPPVREFLAKDDTSAAYTVQQALLATRQASGATVTGRKIGLTAKAVQAQLGVDQPDFGFLLSDMARGQTEPINIRQLIQPKIEAEIAFVLSADLTDPDIDASGVRAAVAYASPALEIVDSRIADWDITFVDTVADNASSGLYVLGSSRLPLKAFEPRACSMTMTIDGTCVSTGSGADCLGDPLHALAWLARAALTCGSPLLAGQVILSGALGPMAVVPPGAHVSADITGLGNVRATFTSR